MEPDPDDKVMIRPRPFSEVRQLWERKCGIFCTAKDYQTTLQEAEIARISSVFTKVELEHEVKLENTNNWDKYKEDIMKNLQEKHGLK